MHDLKHTQGQVKLSMPSSKVQSLQQDREDKQRGSRHMGGHAQSVRGGELTQATTEQPTPVALGSLPPLQDL